MQHGSALLKFTPYPYHIVRPLVLQATLAIVLVCSVFFNRYQHKQMWPAFLIRLYLTDFCVNGYAKNRIDVKHSYSLKSESKLESVIGGRQ